MTERKEKTSVKKIVFPVVLCFLALAGIWIFYQEKVNVIEVVPVSMLRDDWWKDYDMCTGTVTNKMSQDIFSYDGKKMDDLFVELGQKVKTGDVLLTFDVEKEKIDLELKEYEVKEAEIALSGADADQRQNLQHELKQLTLEYETLKKQVEDATVKAVIDGVVKSINPDGADTGAAVMTVASEDKLYVEGVIDEFHYASVTIGSPITAVSWDTGKTFQAKITEISIFPAADSDSGKKDTGNPNVSYYPFTAVITGDMSGIESGESVNIGFDGITRKIFLPLAYLRSEGSRSFVYVRGDNNRLEKRYVTTGQSLYNTVIEIREGLDNEDYVAFPYGGDIREGRNTRISHDVSDVVY